MKRIAERKNHIYYMTKYAVDLVEKVDARKRKEGTHPAAKRKRCFKSLLNKPTISLTALKMI